MPALSSMRGWVGAAAGDAAGGDARAGDAGCSMRAPVPKRRGDACDDDQEDEEEGRTARHGRNLPSAGIPGRNRITPPATKPQASSPPSIGIAAPLI